MNAALSEHILKALRIQLAHCKLLHKTSRQDGEKATASIKRLTWLPESAATLQQEVIGGGVPVVLCGAMAGWTGQSLSIQRLQDDYGSRKVPVEVSEGGATYIDSFQPSPDPSRQFQADVEIPLELLLEHMHNPPASSMRLYLAQKDVQDVLPELAVEPGQLPLKVIKERLWQQSLWLGPEGTTSPLHRDPYHNLLCQVWGAKRILVCNPDESPRVYPFTDRVLRNTSQVDVNKVDHVKFPEFSTVAFQESVLQAGEMLYLPPKYWHYVRSLQASLSLSFWFT